MRMMLGGVLAAWAVGCGVDVCEAGGLPDGSLSGDDGAAAESGDDDGGEDGGEDGGAGSPVPSAACSPAPQALAYSLCACEGLVGVGNLVVRGDTGPAFVGVDGHTQLAGEVDIDGSAIFYGGFYGGFGAVPQLQVSGDLATGGELFATRDAFVAGNVDVGGSLAGVGPMTIGGALRVAGEETMVGELTVGERDAYQEPPLPCGCDEPLVDVAAEVAAAREANDNDAIALPTDPRDLESVTLPGGRYYLEGGVSLDGTKLVIDGVASLYVDGALELAGNSEIELGPEATLDLYVAGALGTIGSFAIGDIDRASDLRIFIGGVGSTVVAPGDQAFYGSIYAPEAYLLAAGDLHIVGAVLVRGFVAAGDVLIEYAAPRDGAGDCPPTLQECLRDPDLDGCEAYDHLPEP